MTTYQLKTTGAIFFSILAVLTGVSFMQLEWAPRIDFDVTGFLFIVSNAGRLTVLIAFLVFTGLAVAYWAQAYVERD